VGVPSAVRAPAHPSGPAEWRPDGAFAAAAFEALQASPAASGITDQEARSALQLSLQQMVSRHRMMGHTGRQAQWASTRLRMGGIAFCLFLCLLLTNIRCVS